MHKIVRDLLKREEIRFLLDAAATTEKNEPVLAIFQHPEKVDDYGEDVMQFKQDVDATVKYLSRMRGKKSDSLVLAAHFEKLLQEFFPDVFHTAAAEPEKKSHSSSASKEKPPAPVEESTSSSSTRKRSRSAIESEVAAVAATPVEEPPVVSDRRRGSSGRAEPPPVQSSSAGSKITAAQKSEFRAAVNSLMKNIQCGPFLYPVDKNFFPDYYKFIDSPMDLTTLKSKISSYDSVQELIRDFRLIWSNCKAFNAEGSDIYNTADELAAIAESNIESIFGVEYIIRKPGRKKSAASIAAIPVPPPPPPQPEVIEAPVEKRGRRSILPAAAAVEATVVVEPPPALSVPVAAATMATMSKQQIRQLIKGLESSEFCFPFHVPVDVNFAPGYSDIILEPMDISTVKKKLRSGAYDADSSEFIKDIRLIGKNCLLYNIPDSDISICAQRFLDVFENLLQKELGSEYKPDIVKAEARAEAKQASSSRTTSKSRKALPEVVASEYLPDAAPEEEKAEPKQRGKARADSSVQLSSAIAVDSTALLKLPTKSDFAPAIAESKVAVDKKYGERKIPVNGKGERKNWRKVSVKEVSPYIIPREPLEYKRDPREYKRDQREFKKDAPAKPRGRPAKSSTPTAASSSSSGKTGKASAGGGTNNNPDTSKGVDAAAGTSAVIADGKQMNSGAQLDKLIAELQTQPSGKMLLVREKAIVLARQRLEKINLPIVIFPSLYTIERLGDVAPWAAAHSSEIIYPSDYSCSRRLRIYQRPSSAGGDISQAELSTFPFVDVVLCSRIRIPTSFDQDSTSAQLPVFSVTLSNGTLVAESPSPRIAWVGILGKELSIIHSLGGRLRKCRSVFNRLAASPGAIHFLEENSMQQSEGSSSSSNFKPLIWLRMIHEQLVQGTYESEFEFAWDMRFLFKSGLQYSQSVAAPEVATAAHNLSVIFENLFAHWVLNVQDISVTHLATGQWDDWMHLRYFDTDPALRNEDHLHSKCRCCGDLKGTAANETVQQDEWVCSRCTIALFWSKNNMSGDPFAAVSNSMFALTEGQFSCEEMHGTCYFPMFIGESARQADPESMRGWMQAKKRHRAELVPIFLSPFGSIVYGYDAIAEQIQKEKPAHDSLLQARVFRSSSASFASVSSYPQTFSFKRLLSSLEGTSEYELSASDRPISLGSVANYSLPEAHRLIFFTCRDEKSVIATIRQGRQGGIVQISQLLQDRVELTADRVPDGGFFGLDLPEVIACIEGLKGLTDVYPEYTFKYIDAAVAEVLQDLKNDKKKYTNIAKGEENLKQLLKYERWYWERLRLNSRQFAPTVPTASKPPQANSNSSSITKHQIGFIQLFPYFLSPKDGDVLLCVWDFIESCKAHIGLTAFSLTELVASVKPVTSPLTTVGQIVFDEINCMFTGFLFPEMQQRADITDDQEWQDLIFSHPINIMTWPHEALLAIRLLSLPGTPSELKSILSAAAIGNEVGFKLDILCLLFNHPLIDHFMLPSESDISLPYQGYSLEDAKNELQLIREGFCGAFADAQAAANNNNETVPQFAARVVLIFCKLFASPCVDPVYKVYARRVHHWLTGLLHRKKISIDSSLAALPPHTEEELSVRASAEKNMLGMKFTRYWGGHSLSNMDIPSDQLLTPHCFGYIHKDTAEEIRVFEGKLRALDSIEKVLHVLSNIEPENMDSASRVAVYGVLLDYSMTVKSFSVTLRARQEMSAAKLSDLKEYGSYLPSNLVPVLEPAAVVNKATRCIYTRIKAKNCPTSLKFVVVPKEYHAQPPILNPQRLATTPTSSGASSSTIFPESNQPLSYLKSSAIDQDDKDGDGGEMDGPKQVVALEKALLRIILMREVARVEQQKYESKLPELLQVLVEKRPLPAVADYEAEKPLSLRSMPLGYDRYGNSYWLLGAQEMMTIFPIITMDLAVANSKPVEPSLLIREASGWWGYHNGHDLKSLVSIFSVDIPCEKFLRECLLERLVFTKRVLFHGTLKLKLVQQEFLDRRARSEKWLSAITIQSNIGELKKAALMETVWARCVEIRMLVHYALIFKLEEDLLSDRMAAVRGDKEIVTRKLDAIRDKLQGDSFDHHPTKGWLRFDRLTRIRELATTTMATKILADSSVFPILQSVLSRSVYLKRLVPPSPSLAMEIEGSSENMEDGGVGKPATEFDEDDAAEDAAQYSSSLTNSADNIPQAEQLLEKMYSKHSHTKCIEQLHLVTGEVLRVYPSGKDAAQFMNVTQSGISLCTSGLRPDCYGFRWRIYEGPPIDFDAIKDRQTPLAELKNMQVMRGKPVAFNREEEAARAAQILLSKQGSKQFDINIGALKSEIDRKSTTVTTRSQLEGSSKDKPSDNKAQPVQPSAPLKPDIVTSNTAALPRLLRLKGELLNILFMLPANRLQWQSAPGPGLSAAEMESEQASIAAAGEKASKSVFDGAERALAARSANAAAAAAESTDEDILKALLNDDDSLAIIDGADVDLSPANVEVLAEQAAEKARRKSSNHLSMQRFIRDVQQTVKPQQLLQLASALQDAIPAEYLFQYNKVDASTADSSSSALISDAVVTVAEVASKIFTIDRSICYDELRGEEAPESAVANCPYRLRTQFSPRCVVNSRCKKFLCHHSRCVLLFDAQNSSRVPDGHDSFITQSLPTPAASSQGPGIGGLRAPGLAPSQQQQQQQQMYQQQQQQQYQRNDLSLREVIKRMKIDKREIDIENTMPYIPGNFEITASEWV